MVPEHATKSDTGDSPGLVNPPSGGKVSTKSLVAVCLLLLMVTLAVYLRVAGNPFVNCDDAEYVLNNAHVTSGLSVPNAVWAFTSVEAANWHPVTWLSHMADVQFFGLNPRGHHLTNVFIHCGAALLLLLLLVRLTGSLLQAAFVAAMFALHPQHVESVAWVAERKDVLGAFFWFLTLTCYAGFAADRKPARYLLTLLSFALGLMSKPMLVSLPIVMLLLDFWPLNRFSAQGAPGGAGSFWSAASALVKEKIPFFALSFLSCLITIYAQGMGGATRSLAEIPPPLRISNALVSYLKYLGTTFWPHDLAMMYPFSGSIAPWQWAGSLAVLVLVSAGSFLLRRRCPYLVTGWLWFLITLVPVIGLMQVGEQAMADRYTYIPTVGLFLMVAWGVPDLTRGLRNRRAVLALLAATTVIVSAALTWQQLAYWQSSLVLFQHADRVTPNSYVIHKYLGNSFMETNNKEAAIQENLEALRLNPDYADAHNNLAVIFANKGDFDASIREFAEVIRLRPNFRQVHMNLGVALAAKGQLDDAIREFRLAVRLAPNDPLAYTTLGIALGNTGDLDAAIQHYQRALQINPNFPEAHNSLGIALARKGNADAAVLEFQKALRITPDDAEIQANLSRALENKRPK